MEIGQIEAFEQAAQEGSFTRAAAALGLTQPAISTRITILEAELGGPLFERHGRNLQLTPLGEQFLPYARRLLAVRNDSIQAVKHFHAGKLGEIRIAAPTPFLLSFLVEALEHFRFQHPTIDVLIRERAKTTIVDMIHDNRITLGLVNAPVYASFLREMARFQDPVRAVSSINHPLAQQETPIHMADIYPYTIYRVSMFPQMTAFIDEVVEYARGGSGGAVIKVPMVMAMRLVRKGQGITFLPERYIKTTIQPDELCILDIVDMPPLISQPILIAHKDRELDDIHSEFIRIFKAGFREK